VQAASSPVPINLPTMTSGLAGSQFAKKGPAIWPSANDMVTSPDMVALVAGLRLG
jgi:hypothetical protein